jgi:Domain of Unknown Function (DUF928)
MNSIQYKFNLIIPQFLRSTDLKKYKITVISSFSIICTLFSTSVLAQVYQAANTNDIQIRFNNTNEPDGASQGRPSGRSSTGSRGDCPAVEMPLEALVPDNRPGSVIEENPTLWFYIPFQSSQVSTGEFSLQDEQKNDVMRTSFKVPTQPGIFSLKIKTPKPLELNKSYKWYFKVYCQANSSKSSIPSFVSGTLQRVAPNLQLEQELKTANTARAKVAVYAKNGIWHTTLTNLALLRIADPNNITIQRDWISLLNDVGLNNLVNKPIVGEIKIQQS